MGRSSLMERYFAQCQAHHTPPCAEFVAGLRDGVVDINLAEISVADIRLFAQALLDASPETATARSSATLFSGSSRQRGRQDSVSDNDVSAQRTAGQASSKTQFVKLHFSHNTAFLTAPHHRTTASPPGSASSMVPQSEQALRTLAVAVAQTLKEHTTTLRSFAWCNLPLTASAAAGRGGTRQSGGSLRSLPSLTDVLPLCRSLTTLRLDGVPLSRAQFMQLTLLSPKSSSASTEGAVAWPALEEASFVGCGLTDACKGGFVFLIRAAVTSASSSMWQCSLRGGIASLDSRLLPQSPVSTRSWGKLATAGLKRLDASHNPLGDETARALASAITGSALRYLNLSGTSIGWAGGSSLVSPSVLEDTAMELVDLSNTGISQVLTQSEGSAEANMLAGSSAAAGFRVVARGMGQLLVLRESAARSSRPSSLIHTNTAIAPQPQSEDASVCPQEDPVTRPSKRVAESGTEKDAGYVAPPVLATQFSALNTGNDRVAPEKEQSHAAVSGPVVSPYYPWWPAPPGWPAAQGFGSSVYSTAAAAAEGSTVVPREGYVLVPAPFPMFAPMVIPYPTVTTAPDVDRAVADVRAAFPKRGVSAAPPPNSLELAPVTQEAQSETPEDANHDELCGETLTGGLPHPLDSASSATQTTADAASASDDVVRRVSDTAGDRKFLLGLITRLEEYEMGITERLEAQYQRTTTQLTLLEKDMRFRLQQLADADRKERALAVDRQVALLEALAALRTEQAAVPAEGMTEAMLTQLMHLIEMGMEKVQGALSARDTAGLRQSRKEESKRSQLLQSSDVATHTDAKLITARDMVKEASTRLKDLGW